MVFEFKLPEVGENIESGQIVNVLVKVGDMIKKEQDLFELETDKASLPIPSPVDGEIAEVLIQAGDDVKVGQLIFRIKTDASVSTSTEPSPASSPAQAQQSQTQPTSLKAESSSDSDYGLVVIGGGPGGYAAAFLASDLGMNVALIDLDVNPGGVCLYRGCIPSKALLHAARVLSESREAKEIGIDFGKPAIDLDRLREWKGSVVDKLTGGLGQLSRQRKITYIQGRAQFKNSQTLDIESVDGQRQVVSFKHAIIATGSRPIELPIAPKSDRIMDSTGALALKDIPKSLLLVGAGYIGLELGTVYAELGSQVSVVEMTDGIIPGADRDLAAILGRRLKKLFKGIMIETKVTAIEELADGLKVTFEDKSGQTFTEQYEKAIVAIGRRPNSENLGLENTQVQILDRGFLKVDGQLRTTDPAIFAIGDVAGNPMLAHKASHEGRVAVEAIAGLQVAFEPKAIPAVVFTDPEIAWAGITETEARDQGLSVEIVKFPWGASGRALTLGRTDGMTKLLIDPDSERILGMSIIGPGAGELIAEGVLAIEMGATVTDIKLSIHPHPTLTETIMETAESFFGQSTHIYRPKK